MRSKFRNDFFVPGALVTLFVVSLGHAQAKEEAEIVLQRGHTAAVNSVVFAHEGSHLASASDDNTIRIWERGSGRLVRILKDQAGSV